MTKKKAENFEDLLQRLEEISIQLESEEVGLEKSVELYEEGTKLAKKCYDILRTAELKVTKLKESLEKDLNND